MFGPALVTIWLPCLDGQENALRVDGDRMLVRLLLEQSVEVVGAATDHCAGKDLLSQG
jgi:hypothetical protein